MNTIHPERTDDDGFDAELPDVELPDVELPDVELLDAELKALLRETPAPAAYRRGYILAVQVAEERKRRRERIGAALNALVWALVAFALALVAQETALLPGQGWLPWALAFSTGTASFCWQATAELFTPAEAG